MMAPKFGFVLTQVLEDFVAQLTVSTFHLSAFRGPTAQNSCSLPNYLLFIKIMFNIALVPDKK